MVVCRVAVDSYPYAMGTSLHWGTVGVERRIEKPEAIAYVISLHAIQWPGDLLSSELAR